MAEAHSRAWEFQLACLALFVLLLGALGRLANDGVSEAALGASAGLIVAGICLDVYGRVAGALAASEEGNDDWAWAAAIGGSPALIVHALVRPGDPIQPQSTPLAMACLMVMLVTVVFALAAGRLDGA